MKIAIVFPATYDRNDFGGMHKVVSILAQEFHENGDEVVMIFLNERFYYPCYGTVLELGVKISNGFFGKLISVLKRCYRLRKILCSEDFDAIYNLFWFTPLVCFRKRKQIVSAIHSDPFNFPIIFRFFVKHVLSLSHLLIVPSHSIAQKMINIWMMKNVVLVPNPIDFDLIAEKMQAKNDHEFLSPFILSVGRLSQEKNFSLLIEAFHLSYAKDEVKLVILGEGREREKLEKLIAKFNLDKKVFLLGLNNNPYSFMKRAIFFISSSLTESFPMAIAESFACGLPVLSTDWLSVGDLVKDGYNGLLVKNNDVKALALAIDKFYFDRVLREKCSINTLFSIKNLAIDKIMMRHREIFSQLKGDI